jgi:hypothetical protein
LSRQAKLYVDHLASPAALTRLRLVLVVIVVAVVDAVVVDVVIFLVAAAAGSLVAVVATTCRGFLDCEAGEHLLLLE